MMSWLQPPHPPHRSDVFFTFSHMLLFFSVSTQKELDGNTQTDEHLSSFICHRQCYTSHSRSSAMIHHETLLLNHQNKRWTTVLENIWFFDENVRYKKPVDIKTLGGSQLHLSKCISTRNIQSESFTVRYCWQQVGAKAEVWIHLGWIR